MKQHKKHKYQQDLDLSCETCGPEGRRFKTMQALRGHLRMIHNVRDLTVKPGVHDQVVIKSGEDTIKGLKNEVEMLRLEQKKRQLEATTVLPAAPVDLMQQAGLGAIEGEAKSLAQMRALGVNQGPAQSWLDKLLSNPEGLKVAIGAVRGILDLDHGGGGGDGTATLLKDLGFNLKDLILASTSPKAGTLSIGGLDLTGANLTPELLTSLIEYKGKTEAAEREYQGKKMMSDTLANAIETIGKGFIERFREGGISQKISDRTPVSVVDNVITCPKCKTENQVPADLAPGQKIQCQGEGCEESWLAVDEKQQTRQPKQERRKSEVEVKEPEAPSLNCPGCGQLLDIAGKVIGDPVVCPICQEDFAITSEDTAIKAKDPDPYGVNSGREFLRSSGRPFSR